MAVIIETAMAEDLDLGVGSVTKTHPSGGALNGTQISLSTFSLAGAAGEGDAELWTPGTIAAGAQTTTTMTVDGAAVGDKVMVSLTSLDASYPLLLTGYVSALNEVTVILANLTGASKTVAEGTLSVLVFHHRVETP